jgi:phosphate transport system substrate-binding protein
VIRLSIGKFRRFIYPWGHHQFSGRKLVASPALMFAVAAALLFTDCSSERKGSLVLAGSTSVEPFAERLAELYMRKHRQIEINVQGGGSSAGIRAVQNGICNIGMSSRALTPEEKGLKEIPIAVDGIVLVVNRKNPVRALTVEQVQAIFSGRIRFWNELGGPRQRITVITREEGSGTRASFEQKVMENRDTTGFRGENGSVPIFPFAPDALVQDSNGAVREIVASDPAAIGYISFGLVDDRVCALELDGVAPSEPTIRSRAYPIVRQFLFLTRGEPPDVSGKFINYVLSPEGQKVLLDEGLVPVAQ